MNRVNVFDEEYLNYEQRHTNYGEKLIVYNNSGVISHKKIPWIKKQNYFI